MYSEHTLPILVIAFRRPDTLKMTLSAISGIPNPIYIWLDGPRTSSDATKIDACLNVVKSFNSLNIIRVLESESNVGIGLSIPKALNWVFEYESEVVVLEDDIVINQEFLRFATDALNSFKDNLRVMSVVGFNCVPMEAIDDIRAPYRFSAYSSSWAWATWRNKWQSVEKFMLGEEPIQLALPPTARNIGARSRWGTISKNLRKQRHVSWDHRWLLVNWQLNKLHLVSNVNLCLNIGFGSTSTHTKFRPRWVPSEIGFYEGLVHPSPIIKQDLTADKWMMSNVFYLKNSFWLKHSIKRLLTRI